MARASKNGLRLAKPWGDSSRYDVVVETGDELRGSLRLNGWRNLRHNAHYIKER